MGWLHDHVHHSSVGVGRTLHPPPTGIPEIFLTYSPDRHNNKAKLLLYRFERMYPSGVTTCGDVHSKRVENIALTWGREVVAEKGAKHAQICTSLSAR